MVQLEHAGLDGRYVDVHVGMHQYNAWGSNHSKTAIIDGYQAVVTGANFQKINLIGTSWHDTGYVVKGEAAMGLHRAWIDTWSRSEEVFSCDTSQQGAKADCDFR